MSDKRTTKYVRTELTATFHGDYLDKDEVTQALEGWLDSGLDDRDDLRGWKLRIVEVREVSGDPERFDSDDEPDWVCVAGNGNEYASHDYDETECTRCGETTPNDW